MSLKESKRGIIYSYHIFFFFFGGGMSMLTRNKKYIGVRKAMVFKMVGHF